MKRVLVTGGAGFLGSHVVDVLQARGKDVRVARSRNYNLLDEDAVRDLLSLTNPDTILHLAAQVGGIGANLENPGKFFYENARMGMNVLEQARRQETKKVVLLGTVCAYPKHTPVPFKEEDLWNGYPEETNAPYGLAKKMVFAMGQAYRQQYGMDVIALFPTNLYGPRDNFDLNTSHVIPALIHKIDFAIKNKAKYVTLWGDGSATRDFLYVEDAAEAIVLAAEKYDSTEPMNLGSGEEISILALARKIADIMDYRGDFLFDTSKPNGQPRRCLDTTRARERLRFSASTSLEVGLKKTIEWWRKAVA